MFFKKQIIQSKLTIEEFASRLKTTDLFIGTVEETHFAIREEKEFANKLLFPIINGQMVKQGDATNTTISFSVCKTDKIGLGVFLIFTLLLCVLLGVVSHDIFLLLLVLFWEVVIAVIFTVVYKLNCRRAMKKILTLTNSKITK